MDLLNNFFYKKKPRVGIKKPYILYIDGIGEVVFKRSNRAKRLIIRVKGKENISVSVPRGIALTRAISFVNYKEQWIKNAVAKIKNEEKQDENNKKIIPIDKARGIIIERVETLADLYGFNFNKISIKKQKTIWGSCSAKNNLNFNYKIASLPDSLRDYVILHELVHTRVKNHSPLFWKTLDNYVKDSKTIRRRLRKVRF